MPELQRKCLREALLHRADQPVLFFPGKSVGYQQIIAPRPDTFIRTLDGLTEQVCYPLCYVPQFHGWFVVTNRNHELFVKWARDELRLMNWHWEEHPRPE